MNNLRLKPALLYQIDYLGKAALIIFGIVILNALFAILLGPSQNITFISLNFANGTWLSGLGVVATFTVFIIGIAGIREDLKMFLQHGCGRYTVFFSTIIAALIAGIGLGLLAELLNLAAITWPNFPLLGLEFTTNPTAQSFFTGWLVHIALIFFAWQLGAFFSLLYYRMSKIQQIIFSAAAIGIFVIGLPNLISRFLVDDTGMVDRMLSGFFAILPTMPWLLLLFCILVAGINFLLLRRAQVKQ